MPSRLLPAFLTLLLALCGCGKDAPVAIPAFSNGGLLAGAAPLPSGTLARLAGVYATWAATDHFGDTVAINAAGDKTLSLYSLQPDHYAILHGGCLNGGSQLVLEGYWRFGFNHDTGLIRLYVQPDSLAAAYCSGTAPTGAAPGLVGGLGTTETALSSGVGMQFGKALVDVSRQFTPIAHHGVCRTIDQCGFSENTLETARQVEAFGSELVELDVRLTADGIPVMFHDENFNERLSVGQFCHGNVSELTLDYITQFCSLPYGEKVPTLDQMLSTIVSETGITGVWLDMKVAEAVRPTVDAILKAQALAKARGRTLTIWIGLPDDPTIAAYDAAVGTSGVPCLIEEDSANVATHGCSYWGPRFTRGAMIDQVKAVHQGGGKVYYWTVNDPTLAEFLMIQAGADGMISDIPRMGFFQAQANSATLLKRTSP